MGFFVADFGNFENGWEDLWEFHDFGWKFLYFGSNHTADSSKSTKKTPHSASTEKIEIGSLSNTTFLCKPLKASDETRFAHENLYTGKRSLILSYLPRSVFEGVSDGLVPPPIYPSIIHFL